MNSIIGIKNIKITCIVGIYPHEREKEQDLFVDIEMNFDIEASCKSENVKDTIDYAEISEKITELAVKKQYQLIETFANDSANLILDNYDVSKVKFIVKKPAAIPSAEYPYIQLEKSK